MTDRQAIRAGSDSVNAQTASGDVYIGMQYPEIRQLFLDLFEQNFETLRADALTEADRRVEELMDAFVHKLEERPRQLLGNLSEPGVQRALIQAQIEHATNGNADDVGLYVELLMDRLAHPGKDLVAIACQQAIEAVGVLTARHIDLLTFIFVVTRVNPSGLSSLEDLREHYKELLAPLGLTVTGNADDIRYLDAQACIAYDTTRAYDLPGMIVGPAQIVPECQNLPRDEVLSLIAGDDEGLRLSFQVVSRDDAGIRSCFITNRGIALAHASLTASLGTFPPIDTWIQ